MSTDKALMDIRDPEGFYSLIFRASETFYELVYADPWLSQVFAKIDRDFITAQQTDFMVGAMGGPRKYSGRNPKDAHPHIYIDESMWEHRESLLKEAFKKCQLPQEIRDNWLRVDNAFKRQIVKVSPSDCKGRYVNDKLIVELNPYRIKRAG